VAACVSGPTDKAGTVAPGARGLLTPEAVRRTAVSMLPRVIAQIDREGVDLRRLRREAGHTPERGRYSWLLGDHGVAQTALSTMF